jgi:hypothetical protein
MIKYLLDILDRNETLLTYTTTFAAGLSNEQLKILSNQTLSNFELIEFGHIST